MVALGITLAVSPTVITTLFKENPQFSQDEVIALVKRDLTRLGIEGYKIKSVDSVLYTEFVGDSKWQGEAAVSYTDLVYKKHPTGLRSPLEGRTSPSYSYETISRTVIWYFYEKLGVPEIAYYSP